MFRVYKIIVISLLLSHCAFAATGDVSQEEKQKQDEFLKAYNKAFTDQDKAGRLKAVEFLGGFYHPKTVQILSTVVKADPEKEVRLEAYKLLSTAPARDTSVSKTMAELFDDLKQDDVADRLEFGKLMENSSFKYFLVNSLVGYCRVKLRYPDLDAGYGFANPNVINKERKEFEDFLKIFNTVAKSDLKAANRNSPQEIVKWWEQNINKFIQADKELADKYKTEDEAKEKTVEAKK